MSSNKNLVPEAKAALDQFKMEAASEVGVNLTNGYNGDLTSRQAGSVGGQMVKIIEQPNDFAKTVKAIYTLYRIAPGRTEICAEVQSSISPSVQICLQPEMVIDRMRLQVTISLYFSIATLPSGRSSVPSL